MLTSLCARSRYKHSGIAEVFSDHYAMLKKNATLPTKENCPEPGWSVELQTNIDRKARVN